MHDHGSGNLQPSGVEEVENVVSNNPQQQPQVVQSAQQNNAQPVQAQVQAQPLPELDKLRNRYHTMINNLETSLKNVPKQQIGQNQQPNHTLLNENGVSDKINELKTKMAGFDVKFKIYLSGVVQNPNTEPLGDHILLKNKLLNLVSKVLIQKC